MLCGVRGESKMKYVVVYFAGFFTVELYNASKKVGIQWENIDGVWYVIAGIVGFAIMLNQGKRG